MTCPDCHGLGRVPCTFLRPECPKEQQTWPCYTCKGGKMKDIGCPECGAPGWELERVAEESTETIEVYACPRCLARIKIPVQEKGHEN